MKRFVSIILAALLFIAFPAKANAIPNKFKNCPTVKQDGITYMLYQNCAIVRKTPNRKTIVIPNKISAKGKTYLVRSIWENTFEMNSALRTVDLKATSLEAIEDPAIFTNHKIKVITHDNGTYKWLKRCGVNVVKK